MKKSTIALVAVLALSTGVIVAWAIKQSQPIKLEAGLWFDEQSRDLPDFELVNQDGKPLKRDDLIGKWHLVFFGYTHCPDICPSSLQTMADMKVSLNDEDVSKALDIIFVSVDPDRDTPEILKNYVQYFNPEFIGATGNDDNLKSLTRNIGISYFLDRTSEDQVSYEVAHSSAFILLNPKAQYAGLFGAPHDSQAMARDITKLVEHY